MNPNEVSAKAVKLPTFEESAEVDQSKPLNDD
jgi:hypothetical protein